MELQYYLQYISSWIYHNVLYTDASFAVLRIILFIGLVSLLVYREYVLFTLLCIVIISAEGVQFIERGGGGGGRSDPLWSWMEGGGAPRAGGVDKDELTTGLPIKEGFSLGWIPKITQGDDTGKDHRRSNKFIEEDSNDFTDKYFKSKQCSIGTGAGGITMFGSNELIGTSRTVKLSGIYDFAGNVTNNITDNKDTTNTTRLKYFMDCVYYPVYRSIRGMEDFRITKKQMYSDANNHIIHIERCLKRFNTGVLFNTTSDITADESKRFSLSNLDICGNPYNLKVDDNNTVLYVSLITGAKNADKMKNIQPLNKGENGDNSSDQTYRDLISRMDKDERYKNKDALKQTHLNVYTKVYGHRKRIDEILSMMRTQTKNDSSLLYTVRVDEAIIQELRTILAYLAIIQRTDVIIKFEENTVVGIYTKLSPTHQALPPLNNSGSNNITGANSIFKIPLDDDTYNTIDEKRYLYGITYYFNSGP